MPRSDEILLLKGPIIEGALVASRARWELFSSESRIGSEAALAMCWLVSYGCMCQLQWAGTVTQRPRSHSVSLYIAGSTRTLSPT